MKLVRGGGLMCDECIELVEETVEMSDSSESVWICRDCLEKALKLFDAPPSEEVSNG
jgi:hypothetical protein